MREPAWAGIAVIYLLNTKISDGIKKSFLRVLGTAIGYAFVVLLFTSPIFTDLYILGPIIVIVGMFVPVFIAKNYLMSQACITAFILLVLEWLLMSYGGDEDLLGWRLFETCWGAICVLIGFGLIALINFVDARRKGNKEIHAA